MTSTQPLTLAMIVKEPSDNDILMGRGGRNNRHPGNQKLRMLTRHFAVAYNACPRMEKPSIHNKIIDQVRLLRPPGRFLEYNKPVNGWIVVDDNRAREKVSQHLRDAVKNSPFSSTSTSTATKTIIQGREPPQTQQLVVDPNMIASYQMHQLQLLASTTTAQLNENKSLQQRSHQQNPLNFANVNNPQTRIGNFDKESQRSHQQNPLNFTAVNPQTQIRNFDKESHRSHQQNPLNFTTANPQTQIRIFEKESHRSHQQNPLNFTTANPPLNFAQHTKPPLHFVTANPQTRIGNLDKESQRSHQQRNPLNFATANPQTRIGNFDKESQRSHQQNPLNFTAANPPHNFANTNAPLNFVTVNPQTRIGNFDKESQRSHKQDPPLDLEKSNPTRRIPTSSNKESQRFHKQNLLDFNKPNNSPPTRTVTSDKDKSYKQRNPLDFDKISSKKIPTYDEEEIRATYHLAALPLLSLREGTYQNNERRGLEPNGINQGRRGLEPQGIDP